MSPKLIKSILATMLALSGCDTDYNQRGVFVIANQSGRDVVLRVFKTQNRQQLPLVVPVANNGRSEREEITPKGFSYPELYFQGDSVRLTFADGKQLTHYCPKSQPSGPCVPERNLLFLSSYERMSIGENATRYTYTLTAADYALAK